MATGVVTKKNLWPMIKANLSLAKGSHAAVGFPGDAPKSKQSREGKGMNNIQVALANEFGSPPGVLPRVPARPFMRQTFGPGMKRRDLVQGGQRLLGMISEGKMSTKIALERWGTMGSSAVKDEITSPGTPFAPNAPFTIAKKKSSHPLIDTGVMRAAVTHKVRMKSGIGAK